MIKLERAYGGCLGTCSRRRTQQAAKSLGESKADKDPGVSEWGNPLTAMRQHILQRAGMRKPSELKHLSSWRKRKQE